MRRLSVRLTANFESNLEGIERFLNEAEAPHAYDGLLDELLGTVIPNLEKFPDMGRAFLSREVRSVEVANALEQLRLKLRAQRADESALREYVLNDYVVLYVQIETVIYLLAIRHHRQLAFDFMGQWGRPGSA